MLVEVKNLTVGEKLLIERRRFGQTQVQAAREWEVSLFEYSNWERDSRQGPRTRVTTLSPQEQCYIMRRRSGKTLAQISRQMGVCRWWLRQMESGNAPVERLVEFWHQWAA